MAESPSREELLRRTDPADLFGPDALGDALALRRAYAPLAKAWRDDQEVSRHLREVYEIARHIADHGPPDDTPAAEEDATDGEAATHPIAKLQKAHQDFDTDRMIVLLRAHADVYVAATDPWLALTLQVLVFGVGERLSEIDLDFVETVVTRPDASLDPGLSQALERGTRTLRAVARAEEDDAVPHVITGAIRASWHQPAHVVARVWLQARTHAEDDDIDLKTAMTHLERHHPTVLGVYQHTEQRMMRSSEDREIPSTLALTKARSTYVPSSSVSSSGQPWLSTGAGILMMTIAIFVMLAPFLGALYGGVLAWGIARVLGVVLERNPGKDVAALHRLSRTPLEPLYEAARDHAMWPHELVLAVVPVAPVPYDEHRYAYEPDHPLVRFRQDPSAVMRCMTLAHVARVPEPTDE